MDSKTVLIFDGDLLKLKFLVNNMSTYTENEFKEKMTEALKDIVTLLDHYLTLER